MTKQLGIFIAIGLAVVGAVVYFSLAANKSSHVELDGEILKVRVMSLSPSASLVIADFRVKNPSAVPFIVRSVRARLEPSLGDPVEAEPISKVNLESVFQYEKLIGPKYNPALTIRDTVAPHETMDRMVGVRFELPESTVEGRKSLLLRIEEVDGASAEITEKK